MSLQTTITPADLYSKVAATVVADPHLEADLLGDFDGTIAKRFGVVLPKPGKLVRAGDGFKLSYDGADYDLPDPRKASPGELNDAELELVSGGCQVSTDVSQQTAIQITKAIFQVAGDLI